MLPPLALHNRTIVVVGEYNLGGTGSPTCWGHIEEEQCTGVEEV